MRKELQGTSKNGERGYFFVCACFFYSNNRTYVQKGGKVMKTMEIETCGHRTITLPFDLTRENIDAWVNAIVAIMEEIMIAELYRIMLLQDGRTFCNIKIRIHSDEFKKTYDRQFPIVKSEMIVNEVWRIDATLRLEVERDLLRSLLK